MSHQQTRMRRQLRGLCVECGLRPPEKGKKYCAECAAKISAAHEQAKLVRISEGRCTSCGAPLDENSTSTVCQACREKSTQRHKEARSVKKLEKQLGKKEKVANDLERIRAFIKRNATK